MQRTYLAIDLKSYYASAECAARHLDPLTTLTNHVERQRLAASFAEQLAGLDAAQLDYKGLAADRDRLVETLLDIAEAQAPA